MVYQKTKRSYDKVALIYNGLMKHVDFNHWTKYILEIAAKFAGRSPSLLELAAGTCTMAEKIKNKYSNVIATDISFPMLISNSNSQLKKVCCSMLELPFKDKFDFIYCTFDSVNYLLTKKELQLLFNETKSVLHHEGIFTFDASLENNSIEFIDRQVSEDKYNGFSFKRVNSYNKKTRIHKNVFYIYNISGVKYKDVHKQKIYEFETYFDLIERAGLIVKECYDGFNFKDGSPESERVQFIVGNKPA
jgi:ubiquinone/menaquinone biosynthesis C-methylase UbiE